MKKKTTKQMLLTVCAVALVLLTTVGTAFAYFSDHEEAQGGATLKLQGETTLHEEMDGNNKHITIENTGETPVIVRVRIFAADFAAVDPGADWIAGADGWYYYNKILPTGTADTPSLTSDLYVEVSAQSEGGQDTSKLPDYDFNIIVVHESARTVYEDNTTLQVPAGWDSTAVSAVDLRPAAPEGE